MAQLKLHYPDGLHQIGIEFISNNEEGEDARAFLTYMRSDAAKVRGESPFHQGSDSRHNWNKAEYSTWEFFEYLTVSVFNNNSTSEVINVLLAASKYLNIEIATNN